MDFEEACMKAYDLLKEDEFYGFYMVQETPEIWVFYGGDPHERFYGLRTVYVDKKTKICNWFDINHLGDRLNEAKEIQVPERFYYK